MLVCWEEISESVRRKREEEGRKGERFGNLGCRVRVLEFWGSGGLLRKNFLKKTEKGKGRSPGVKDFPTA